MKKSTQRKIWAWSMRLGNRCGCHQREDRSFKIGEFSFLYVVDVQEYYWGKLFL